MENEMRNRDGLTLGYRFKWRLNWLLLTVAGPAQQADDTDPRRRMERERAALVAQLRAERAQG
ncbi:hypothetical protein ACQEVI_09805 [Promicromonospora sp. CA-289599]|uniref:hypothetical protein n=1 Tax=Promicromonospora sp. CA-289599 TaxID=3240014 RepID=UPI003D932905